MREHSLRTLIYLPHLLPLSQPWALQHATLLPNCTTALVGRKTAASSLDLSDVRSFTLSGHPLGESEGALLLATGRSPRLTAFVRAFKPDLIHAHFGPGGTEIMDIAAACNIPLVVSYHGYDVRIPEGQTAPTPYQRIHLARRARLFKQAALILTASDWLRGELIKLGCAPEKVERHYLGVDRALFDGVRADDGGKRIAMVGRLVRFKGTHHALEAFSLLRARVPDVSVDIYGSGPEHAALAAFVKQHALPVTLHGARSHRDARDLFARSRVHCFPSTAEEGAQAEGFGLAAAEAQAMGAPVVAAATGAIPEVVIDGETGLLAPDADPPALAAALERMLIDDALHARLATAGKQRVAERFDVRTNTSALAERYAALLDADPRAKERAPGTSRQRPSSPAPQASAHVQSAPAPQPANPA